MRVALKIAYDGRAFHGHQRQPNARTVEGECLTALRAAKILRDPQESYFRSASRTDRGVSAVGNVIAFDSVLRPDAALGAFNDRARDVLAWAYAEVPERFHPRHAIERWYRYHLFDNVPVDALREAGSLFVGEHDFRHFTSDPPSVPFAINRIDVAADTDTVVVDVHARSFRRGMVRRIVAAMLSHARGDGDLERIRAALRGERQDFGVVPPEPLFLMDVDYGFPFSRLLQPKVFDESQVMRIEARLRLRWLNALDDASSRSRKA